MSTSTHSGTAQLAAKIKPIRFAMFTTLDDNGHLVSRPMTNQDMDEEGNLWFFASSNSDLWENIAVRAHVNVAFSEPADHLYVSVSGKAERVVDRARIKALWNPAVQAWYPNGPDDPHVMLIKVVPYSAEYWDSNGSAMVQLFKMAKAVLTHTTPDEGEHGKIKL
ncbi:MAG: pyridoxamine 5'-phosphate oxidase family protein [Gammaproteobacteria bacterium]